MMKISSHLRIKRRGGYLFISSLLLLLKTSKKSRVYVGKIGNLALAVLID